MVLEKKIFQGFYHIWAWRPCWSCDPDHLNNFSFLKALEAVEEYLVAIGPVVSEEKSYEIVDGRRTSHNRPRHQLTICHIYQVHALSTMHSNTPPKYFSSTHLPSRISQILTNNYPSYPYSRQNTVISDRGHALLSQPSAFLILL